jgi:glucokinase
MPRHDPSGAATTPARITGTFLDGITHDIPAQNGGPAERARDFDAMKAIGIDTPRAAGPVDVLASAAESGERGVCPAVTPRSTARVGRRGVRNDGGSPGTGPVGVPRDDAAALAIDLGGTKVAFAVVDPGGAVLSRSKRPSHEAGRAVSFDALAASAADTVRAAGLAWADLRAAGVVVPGVYDTGTGRAWAPNLWGRDEVPLLGELRDRLPVRVIIDSDRSGYVLGEAWLGAARGCTDVVFLAVGTGIGAGILSNGRLVRGSGGIAGAVGWLALDPRWREDYGRMGSFEAEAAGPALAGRAGTASAEEVAEAARRGDPVARRAVDETVEWLAMGTANLISVLDPQVVVLGGGLMQAADLFLEPLRHAVRRWAQPIAAGRCRIETTALGEDAALFGAARLALGPTE